jgi:hypothetical protein
MSKRHILMAAVLLVACGAAILSAQPAARDPASKPARPPRGEGPGPGLSEQQESEFLGMLEKTRPEEAVQLKKLKEENPVAYHAAMSAAWRVYQALKDMPPEIQEAHKTQLDSRVKAWRVSRDYLAAQAGPEKDKLRARLTELLGAEFDAEQTIREYRLNQLEDQLKHLRAELKDRQDRRGQVIEQNLQELLSGKFRPKGDGEIRRGPEGRPRPQPATRPAE